MFRVPHFLPAAAALSALPAAALPAALSALSALALSALSAVLLVLPSPGACADAPDPGRGTLPIDLATARRAFGEARAASEADGGALWGRPISGPILLVDAESRLAVANQPDTEGALTEQDGVFTGLFPVEENVANTAVTWSGVRWTMLQWPLPANRYARTRLLMHECFHRIQDTLGLPGSNPANAHLDEGTGRIWLRLEWRALQEALIRRDEARRRAAEDALLFRAYRRALIPGAAEEENALEMNEGVAEYTGHKLSGWPESILADRAAVRLEQEERGRSFTRAFAYGSGPAYGVLLDEAGAPWRTGLTARSDFGELLSAALGLKPAGRAATVSDTLAHAAATRAAFYDYQTVAAEEERREIDRQKALARNQALFVDGPVLVLPLSPEMSYSSNPMTAQSFGAKGTVYGTTRVVDAWGILEAGEGALMLRDDAGSWVEVRVSAPTGPEDPAETGWMKRGQAEGSGWKLSLNAEWRLATGPRAGDYTIRRKPAR